MDGIFGIGIPEMIIIVLAILIIGGPRNAVKWSGDLGRMLRKLRIMWGQMMADLEKDLGPEGKELMSATRDLTRNVQELRSSANPRKLAAQATRLVEDAMTETKVTLQDTIAETTAALEPPANDAPQAPAKETSNGRYSAWTDEE
jgi:Sec-independent protein translocase protein TatA